MGIECNVVAVPARLQSSRLPNKVLADIGGKPMIRRVLEQCAQAPGLDLVVLCTDSPLLHQLARLGVSGLANGGALQFRQRTDCIGCRSAGRDGLGGAP